MTLDTPPDRAAGNGTAAGTGQVRLPVGEADLGLLPGTEQEVPEERDTVGSRIEPHDACGLRLEEHIAGPEHRFRLPFDLEGDRAVDDASDHGAVVHMETSGVTRDYPNPTDLDAVRVLGLQVYIEQHVAGYGRLRVRNGAGRHFPSSIVTGIAPMSAPDTTQEWLSLTGRASRPRINVLLR